MLLSRYKALIYLLLVFLPVSWTTSISCTKEKTQTVSYDTVYTYTNPVGNITNIGDPYVLKYNGKYYLYATSAPDGFKVWESDNLVDWEWKGMALDAGNPANNWGSGNFWAPEVKFYKNKFYMTYSAIAPGGKMKIRIATADDPLGPFTNWSDPFFNDDSFSYIDGDLLLDSTRNYLYYVKDCSQNIVDGNHVSQIFVVELDADLKKTAGDPKLILSPSQEWEGIHNSWQWNEGPFVFRHDSLYYLMYSANLYSSPDYSIGYATSRSPEGTWSKYANNPVLAKDTAKKVSGPGHNCVTTSPDGKELFIVYHTHTNYNAPSGDRNVCIDRLYFENGVLKVKGPTRDPQKLPSGDPPRIIFKELQ